MSIYTPLLLHSLPISPTNPVIMAAPNLLPHLLTFSLLSLLSLSHSHSNVLDVSASLRSAAAALHPHHQAVQEQEVAQELLSHGQQLPLSVKIHPRISLPTSHRHSDYESLTASRLARDSSRVSSLLSRLELSLRGLSPSDLRPDSESSAVRYGFGQEALAAPVSSGTSQGSGEYFSRVGVGSPSRPYYMVIDTGSDVSWLQCQPCSDCYQQSDPIYQPSSSSSFSPVPCSDPLCTSLDISVCQRSKCLYQVSYGDGSYTVGDFVTETLSFGSSGAVNRVAIGCGHDNEGLFVGAAGLLGLGGGRLSLTSQIKATSFSYCLVDRDSRSSSTLEFNTAAPSGSVSAKLTTGKVDTFYYVALTGMSVGGQPLSIPPSLFADQAGSGGVIVDSGTAVTRLPTQAYNSLRDAFTRLTQHLPSAGTVALFDTCYDLSSMTRVRVPTVAFNFAGGASLQLPAKNYLIPVDSAGTFCFAFAPTTSSMSIIGNVQQQGTRVHFDLARSTVAFSQNNC